MGNTNSQICIICRKEINPIGLERSIRRDHQERDLQYSSIFEEDFKNDGHLKCRITCAIYYEIGLAPRWYAPSPYEVTQQNEHAYKLIEKLKELNFSELRSNGIFLYGQPGLGKTHLLSDLCRNLIERGAIVNPKRRGQKR